MAILDRDIKLLWGRAAARCSHPHCDEDLTVLLGAGAYVVGEMAHVIGRRPGAARAGGTGGPNTYDNLILLCPNHHSHIDKAPAGTYPEQMLRNWKREHESRVGSSGAEVRFSSIEDLRQAVCRLLGENKAIFDAFGPRSDAANEDPASNLYEVWTLRRLDKILPNNRRLINLLAANCDLLPVAAIATIEKFKLHVLAFEQHVYDPLDRYPRFPTDFAEVFQCP